MFSYVFKDLQGRREYFVLLSSFCFTLFQSLIGIFVGCMKGTRKFKVCWKFVAVSVVDQQDKIEQPLH